MHVCGCGSVGGKEDVNRDEGQINQKIMKWLSWKYGAQHWQQGSGCRFLNAVSHGMFEKRVPHVKPCLACCSSNLSKSAHVLFLQIYIYNLVLSVISGITVEV